MLYYFISIALVIADQGLKWWTRENIPLGESIPFIPHVMDLAYTQNTGAAFSSFSDMTWLLALVSLAASVGVAVLLAKSFFPGVWGKLSLSLILAGAVGNLIDRVLLGFVTDMFKTTFIDFAIFNVADICVVIGGILMAVYVIFLWDKDRETGNDPS